MPRSSQSRLSTPCLQLSSSLSLVCAFVSLWCHPVVQFLSLSGGLGCATRSLQLVVQEKLLSWGPRRPKLLMPLGLRNLRTSHICVLLLGLEHVGHPKCSMAHPNRGQGLRKKGSVSVCFVLKPHPRNPYMVESLALKPM